MQNVGQGTSGDNQKLDQVNAQEVGKSSTPESSNSSPTKSETVRLSGFQPRYMTDSSVEDEDDVSEEDILIEPYSDLDEAEAALSSPKFLLNQEEGEQSVDPETQARLEALLEAAGIGKLATGDGKQLADPEVLRRLTSSVSCALDEAAAALTRMRTENTRPQPERTLVEACTDGDVGTVKKLLTEGRSVHETTEEGESLLSLACSAGYYELAQVLLAMHANVEDRGIKGDCTPLMEAASSGYPEIVQLLIHHGADVNAQSTSGNTPLMYACAGGHNEVVRILLDNGANVEDHNENGHTPLMEAASAGHVQVAATLLERGAGINTHSNEFKESALTLACYKGHLDMVRFLLDAGADQEHKTDEMHTALMEASMDGHVEVARLLLDSGAQVNMPTDSFESPLTLAACGGHVELALLLLERGANIEEVNDEGYTPLMEAAREGHEDMVSLLLSHGADINAQTEETQETALTLACCGGFLDVADFLIQKGAEMELGASTPLMESSQEGHLDLVRYLVEHNADVNAQTQTGDTALTYACENGHTEVARLLLQSGANLEHESEGGRTPLMKACRAGHLCTVKFLLSMNANVNKQTTNNDHTPLSLAAAGGHISVVELLLAHNADPFHKLKDNSTMLIEAAKGGHTNVVQLLLDYPHSMMGGAEGTPASPTAVTPPDAFSLDSLGAVLPPPPPVPRPATEHFAPLPLPANHMAPRDAGKTAPNPAPSPAAPIAASTPPPPPPTVPATTGASTSSPAQSNQKALLRKGRLSLVLEAISHQDQAANQATPETDKVCGVAGVVNESCKEDALDKGGTNKHHLILDQQYFQRQQIVEELQRFDEELKEKRASREGGWRMRLPLSDFLDVKLKSHLPPAGGSSDVVDLLCESIVPDGEIYQQPPDVVPLPPPPHHTITLPSEVVSSTAISDRPKAKPTWKKEGKNARKQALPDAYQLVRQVLPEVYQLGWQLGRNQSDFALAQALQQQAAAQPAERDEMLMAFTETEEGFADDVQTFVAHVKKQLDFTVASVATPTSQPSPEVQPMGGCSFASELLSRCPLSPEDPSTDHSAEDSILDALSNCKATFKQQDQAKEDINSVGMLGELVKRASTELGGTDKMNFHLGVLKNLHKAAANKVLMPAVGSSPLFQVDDPTAPSDQPSSIYHTIYNNNLVSGCNENVQMGKDQFVTSGLDLAATLMEPKGRARPSLATPPPPAQPPAQQLVLKTPPPPPCDCHVSKVESCKEQVQQGTQTSPALLPSDSSRPDTPAPTPSTKPGKKAKYQQKAATTQPPPHPHHHGVVECVTTAAAGSQFCMDVDSATESNNDTALTLASAGGHEELVELLLSRGANIEHRDKKGFTPLILAATAGHDKVVEILLNHSADMEAQSERTKDTPLSLACSGGRYEVVELLLQRGANKEHRNVSDYTPLSLAASGGYVNIIKLLLNHGAEINSRTGSKLGISPLMLAAMNGHTAAVKLLLDMGSDINAQIETNRNTALTLACFQGRHEVVSLLLDRKANVEHRAKTGLTPLMEAASGGYVEVGRVLLDKGADVNAPPVPSSRDTALTIAADKGHGRFVELLLSRHAQVEVKNKKGNSPLWLAANGGHLQVVELLYHTRADIDSQDNRKVSCLMAAFRKGHVKVVKWMVNHVNQFPSDQEMNRYISTVNDKELLDKCQECVKVIRVAKDQQAAKANKNASILLEELFMEKTREESRRAAAARRRERKKKRKLEKRKALGEKLVEEAEGDGAESAEEEPEDTPTIPEMKETVSGSSRAPSGAGTSPRPEPEEGDSGIDANSQGSCSSTEQVKPGDKKKDRKKKKQLVTPLSPPNVHIQTPQDPKRLSSSSTTKVTSTKSTVEGKSEKVESKSRQANKVQTNGNLTKPPPLVFETRHPADRDDFESTGSDGQTRKKTSNYMMFCEEVVPGTKGNNSTSPKQAGKREEGWKEVVRNRYLNNTYRSKKVAVPLNAISRVIGRGGSNINAIRTATGAHIEVEKQSKGQGERTITLKGSTEATKQAHTLITALIKDPDVDILQLLPKSAKSAAAVWEKSVNTAKSKPGVKSSTTSSSVTTKVTSTTVKRPSGKEAVTTTSSSKAMSYTAVAGKSGSRTGTQTFAAKLSEAVVATIASLMSVQPPPLLTTATLKDITTSVSSAPVSVPVSSPAPVEPIVEPRPPSPKKPVERPKSPEQPARSPSPPAPAAEPPPEPQPQPPPATTTLEYSLFNDNFTKVAQQSMWGQREGKAPTVEKGMSFASAAPAPPKYLEPGPQADASKAPGYRPAVCSPVSKTYFQPEPPYSRPQIFQPDVPHDVPMQPPAAFQPQPPPVSMSRLNPRAPDFSSTFKQQMYSYPGGPPLVPVSFSKFARPPTLSAQAAPRWHLPTIFPTPQMELLTCATPQENGVEERKPRPIGTERMAWKQQQVYPEEWDKWGNVERHQQIIRPPIVPRVPHHVPDDLSHLIDNYQQQGGLEAVNLNQFGAGHYAEAPLDVLGPPPCWMSVPDHRQVHEQLAAAAAAAAVTPDKHAWTAKWSH